MITGKFACLALVSLLCAGTAWGKAPRPPVDAAKAGLDAAKLCTLRAALQKYVDDKKIAGAVTVIGRKDHLASVEVVGARDVENKKAMELDTVFRIASMSKIATSVGIMILEDDGKLSVDDPVETHLPEFRGQKMI
jgi:CubicO group peptidase (beta-lactamase class C family)